MMKVLLVDDEKIMRIGLKMMIPWEEHGYELCGGAEDGHQALDMVNKYQPDIVITDLRMPRMDGLEMIQYLISIPGFRGKIIALSNYGEYELVREALKLGAIDYLLKVTLKPAGLLAVLDKAAVLLRSEREEKEEERIKSAVLMESYRLSKNQFFKDLVFDEYFSEQEIDLQASKLQIAFGDQKLFLFFIQVDRYDKRKWNYKQLFSFSIYNIVSELIHDSHLMEIAEISNRSYIVLLPHPNQYMTEQGPMHLARQISDMLHLYLNLEVNIVISQEFEGLQSLKKAYWSCAQAVGARFYASSPVIMHVHEAECQVRSLPSTCSYLQEEMISSIRSGEIERLKSHAEALMNAAEQEEWHPSLLLRSVTAVLEFWEARSSALKYRYVLPASYREALEQAGTLDHFKTAMEEAIEQLYEHAPPVPMRKYRKEVRDVIEYLTQHIDRKITLDRLADHVKLNESHLSRLFKSETGKSIVNYLNELRMERARELLRDPDLSVKSVSEKVGISDQFYFNRLFRKLYGQSPTDYKKNSRKGQNRP